MLKTDAHRRFILLSLAMILAAGPSSPGFAQAYTSQVAYLESYATRLFDRGDYAGAWKEFSRINRLDPNNTSAAKYLKLIAAKSKQAPSDSRPALEHINAAIADINSLRIDITHYETSSHDLEYLIRNLITENDSLYSMLYLRSRELGELRAKFNGTPYAAPFDTLMKSLPPDRVPQHLHQSEDLLKLVGEAAASSKADTSAAAASASADEIQSLIQSASARPEILTATRQSRELTTSIEDRRDLLVDKTIATIDRQKNLTGLKSNLGEMNAKLKTIDTYYQSIKTELAQKNFTEQKQFSDLMLDYAAKLREIDVLKTRIENDDKALAKPKTGLVQQNASLTDINAELAAKDRQISEFKALLVKKNALIEKQSGDLKLTDAALDTTRTKLTSIESLLQANDNDLAELQDGMVRMRTVIQSKHGEVPPAAAPVKASPSVTPPPAIDIAAGLKAALAEKERLLAKTIGESTNATAALASAQAKAADALMMVNTLKDENALLRTINSERASFGNTLTVRLKQLTDREKNTNAHVHNDTSRDRLDKAENQLMEARASLSEKNLELQQIKVRLRSLETDLANSETTARQNHNALLAQQETLAKITAENTRLNNEVDVLLTETEKQRGRSIEIVSGQPVSTPAPLPPADPDQARILQETIAGKDDQISQLKQKLAALSTVARETNTARTVEVKTTVRNYSLDVQEKNTRIKTLEELLNEKSAIIDETDQQSRLLQEKLEIMEAKQDAIKGVVQKRDMEFLRAQASVDATARDLAQTTAERDRLKKERLASESAAELAENRLKQREDEISRLNLEIASLQTTTSNAHEEIARLNAELKKRWK